MIMDYVIALTLVSVTIWLFIISAYLCRKKFTSISKKEHSYLDRRQLDYISEVLLPAAIDGDTGKIDEKIFVTSILNFLRDEGVL